MIFLSKDIFAQSVIQYPNSLSQFFNYYAFLNPAAIGTQNKFGLQVGEQAHTGNYSRIRYFFAHAEGTVNHKEHHRGHAYSVSFTNNREGNLLSIKRIYLQYAYHLALTDKWNISGGISAGLINFAAEQTSSSGQISSFAPDGGLGLWLYSDKEKIGISSAQILDRHLLVINERIPIQRFYRLIYSRNFTLTSELQWVPSALFTLKREGLDADVNGSIILKDKVLLGLSYRHHRGSAFIFGIKDLSVFNGLGNITLSYNPPWPAPQLGNIQAFEMIMSYTIR
jgi:type IX secretion system PorP/SprF family membrane protein